MLAAQGGDLKLELEMQGQADAYYVNPMGDDGLVLFYPTDSVNAFDERMWSFIRYTSDFIGIWDRQIVARPGLKYARHAWDGLHLQVLLMSERPRGKRKFQVFSLNTESGELVEIEGVIPYNLKITDFSVVRNLGFIAGETQQGKFEKTARKASSFLLIPAFLGINRYEEEAVHYLVNVDSMEVDQLRYKFNGVSTIQNQARNKIARSMSSIVYNSPTRKEDFLYIKEYAGDKLIRNLEVSPKSDRRLLSGYTTHVNRDEFIVAGTYAQAYFRQKFFRRLGAFLSGERLPNYANGIYITKIGYRGQIFTQFYNFAEFEDFWSSYKPRQKRKVKRKQKRKKKKGKEVLLDFKLDVHQLIETDKTYLLVGRVIEEASERQQRQMARDINNANSRSHTSRPYSSSNSRSSSSTIKPPHEIIAAFDKKDGKILWDASFPIKGQKSVDLGDRMQVLIDGDTTTLVYQVGSSILGYPLLPRDTTEAEEVAPKKKTRIPSRRSNTSKSTRGKKKLSRKERKKQAEEEEEAERKEPVEPKVLKRLAGDFSINRVGFKTGIVYWHDNYFLAWGYEKEEVPQGILVRPNKGEPQRVFLYKIGY